MNEPKLRFKADDGGKFPDWEEKSFEQTFSNLNNSTFSRDCLNYENGNVKYIHYGDILVKFGETVDVNNCIVPYVNDDLHCEKYNTLENGDVVIADTAEDETVGKVVEISETDSQKTISGLHTIACRPKEKFASKYLGYFMNSDTYHNQLRPYMQGIKVTSISKANIKLTSISIPSLSEQQKIAEFLSTIDTVIEKQKETVSAWEERKKGVMQKLFNQEVRFKADDGSNFPEWEEKKLGEVMSVKDVKQIPTEEAPLMAFIAYQGVAEKGDRYDRSFLVKSDNKKYKRTDFNDFIYSSNNLDVGSIGLNKYGSAVISVVYEIFTFKDGFNPDCMNLLIQQPRIMSSIIRYRQGCLYGQYKIHSRDFLNVLISVPCMTEQQKIADCLVSFDEVIEKQKATLSAWEELKKGLLQQMFV